MCDDQPVIHRLRAVAPALVGLGAAGALLAGAGLVSAEPADPSAPIPTYPMSAPSMPAPVAPAAVDPAVQPPVAVVPAALAPVPVDPAAPPPRDPFVPYVPEIQDRAYGAGTSGGGVFGTLKDLWQQVQNPTLAPNEMAQPGSGSQPLVSAPVPPLPPGYVSINLPGSETPGALADGGPPGSGPALPPGYYPLDGPPPPGYEYLTPTGMDPAATTPPTPAAPGS